MPQVKLVAIRVNENNECIDILKVKHINEQEYELLEYAKKKHEMKEKVEKKLLEEKVDRLEKEIEELKNEIKFLKGEE